MTLVRRIQLVSAVAISAVFTGFLSGHLWILGNRAAVMGVWWLILLALFSNLLVAAGAYYPVRGAVHWARGGIVFLILLLPVHLVVTLGTAVWVADATGAGTAVKMGAHTFSWGMSYAYGQAIHDVRHGTWLGD